MGNAQAGQEVLTDERLKETFHQFDINGDGNISANELQTAIEELLQRTPSDSEVKMLIDSVDQNLDGSLQIDEFINLVRKYNAWLQGGALDSWERLGEELYELALRKPLLPGFLAVLGLDMYADSLILLGYQMSTDLAYLKADRVSFTMKPVHMRKLLHCAAVMRCRKPPHLLSEAELSERLEQRPLLFRNISARPSVSSLETGEGGGEKEEEPPATNGASARATSSWAASLPPIPPSMEEKEAAVSTLQAAFRRTRQQPAQTPTEPPNAQVPRPPEAAAEDAPTAAPQTSPAEQVDNGEEGEGSMVDDAADTTVPDAPPPTEDMQEMHKAATVLQAAFRLRTEEQKQTGAVEGYEELDKELFASDAALRAAVKLQSAHRRQKARAVVAEARKSRSESQVKIQSLREEHHSRAMAWLQSGGDHETGASNAGQDNGSKEEEPPSKREASEGEGDEAGAAAPPAAATAAVLEPSVDEPTPPQTPAGAAGAAAHPPMDGEAKLVAEDAAPEPQAAEPEEPSKEAPSENTAEEAGDKEDKDDSDEDDSDSDDSDSDSDDSDSDGSDGNNKETGSEQGQAEEQKEGNDEPNPSPPQQEAEDPKLRASEDSSAGGSNMKKRASRGIFGFKFSKKR